jgi:SnoaL-like domain
MFLSVCPMVEPIYGESRLRVGAQPVQEPLGPPSPVFADLNRYDATTHFNGQSTVTIDGDRATGESYTIAHHLFSEDGSRKIMIASLRYLDTYTKMGDAWYFAEPTRCTSPTPVTKSSTPDTPTSHRPSPSSTARPATPPTPQAAA